MENRKETVSEASLPEFLKAQCCRLEELDQKARAAQKKAEQAMAAAKQAQEKGGFFRQTKATKANQRAIMTLAEANEANAQAMALLAAHQREISQIMRLLFEVGTSSLAMIRATIQHLEEVLREDSAAAWSDSTKEELRGVIEDLKSREDFMLRQKKTEAKAKEAAKMAKEADRVARAQAQRVSRLERNQWKVFAVLGLAVAVLLAAVLLGGRQSPAEEGAGGRISAEWQPEIQTSVPPQTPPTAPGPTADTEETTAAEETVTESTAGGQEPAEIDMDSLVGASQIDGDVYFCIARENGTYWFNFVISKGSVYHYLYPAVPLENMGDYAQASYDDDHQGNSGTVRICLDAAGRRYITAEIDKSWVAQYDDYGYLSALIFDREEMHYDKKIEEYTIFLEYLSETGKEKRADLRMLLERSYTSRDDWRIELSFSNYADGSVTYEIKNTETGENLYRGAVSLSKEDKDRFILSGRDEATGSAVQIEYYGIYGVTIGGDEFCAWFD